MASDFEVLVDLVRQQMGDDTVAWGVFRVAASQKDSPRRVVWIPTDFRCEGVQSAPLIRHSESGADGDVLLTMRVNVECEISGVDFEDACLIHRYVLNSVRRRFGTSSTAIDGAFVTEQQGHSGYLWGGAAKIVQRFLWTLNVPRVNEDTDVEGSNLSVVVEHIEQTGELQADAPAVSEETLFIPPPP